MRRKVLEILTVISIVVALTTQLAIPVMAQSDPPGANTAGVGISITAYKGGLPVSVVHLGDDISYRIELSVPDDIPPAVHFNFQNGNIFLDIGNQAGTVPLNHTGYVQVAGQPGFPAIPKVSHGSPFIYDTPFTHEVVASELELIGGKQYLVAHVGYGENVAYSGGINGTFLSDPVMETASGTTSAQNLLIAPNTAVAIIPSSTSVDVGQAVTLDITETNTGDSPLTDVSVNFIGGGLNQILTKGSLSFQGVDGPVIDTLDKGEVWTWRLTSDPLNANTDFTATGTGKDSTGVWITIPAYPSESTKITVNVNKPSTTAHISVVPSSLPDGGGPVKITVTEKNDGFVDLENVIMVVTGGATTYNLTKASNTPATGKFMGGDTLDDGILSVNELWTWEITGVPVTANTTFTVNGDATYGTPPDPVVHVNFSTGATKERESASVTIEPPPHVPASSDLGLLVLIGGFTGLMLMLFSYRKQRVLP